MLLVLTCVRAEFLRGDAVVMLRGDALKTCIESNRIHDACFSRFSSLIFLLRLHVWTRTATVSEHVLPCTSKVQLWAGRQLTHFLVFLVVYII